MTREMLLTELTELFHLPSVLAHSFLVQYTHTQHKHSHLVESVAMHVADLASSTRCKVETNGDGGWVAFGLLFFFLSFFGKRRLLQKFTKHHRRKCECNHGKSISM